MAAKGRREPVEGTIGAVIPVGRPWRKQRNGSMRRARGQAALRLATAFFLSGCRPSAPAPSDGDPVREPAPAPKLDGSPETATTEVALSPREPVDSASARDAHAHAWSAIAREGEVPELGSTPTSVPGLFVPIVDPPAGPALTRFHEALSGLARGERTKVRVAMYGASGTAADLGTGYVRAYLQHRFGAGGPGFVPLVPLSRWYRHEQVKVRASKGWKKEHAQIGSGRKDGRYGYLGASFATDRARQWAQVESKATAGADAIARVELHVLAQPGGGRLRVLIDGRLRETISTASEHVRPMFVQLDVKPGRHTVRVETVGDGEVRLFGVVLESDRPGVVLDTLGIDGTRATNHVQWDEAIWAEAAKRRELDLVTLSYGTNESVDEDDDMTIPQYREHLRTVLERLRRTLPDVDCLMLVPVDFPLLVDGDPQPRPRLLEIVQIQRELAPRYGCGLWDGMKFMGGPGSMSSFVQADPPLARDDYLHFNRRGAARKAQAFADAVMAAYDAASVRDSVQDD